MSEFFKRKIIVLDTVKENEIEDVFKEYPVLPSSEIFYFLRDFDGVSVNQSKNNLINSMRI